VSSSDILMQSMAVRKSFLLFIKIFFKYIANDELMLEQCKLIVYKCRLHWRSTQRINLHNNFMVSLQVELKRMVGDSIWNRTMIYYTHYRSRRILHQRDNLKGESTTPKEIEIAFPTEMSEFLSSTYQMEMGPVQTQPTELLLVPNQGRNEIGTMHF
jgi:hypothetical protein